MFFEWVKHMDTLELPDKKGLTSILYGHWLQSRTPARWRIGMDGDRYSSRTLCYQRQLMRMIL